MSEGALYETARALADRGIDYGWDVYRNGVGIPPDAEEYIEEQGGAGWLEAYGAAIDAYVAATGKDWQY